MPTEEPVVIQQVLAVSGFGGFYVDDLQAVKAGRAVPDGMFLTGSPVTPGFTRIREPAEVLSILLLLSDRQVAQGDCVSVVYSGYGGRDPVFRAETAAAQVERDLAPALVGRDVRQFRPLAEACEAEWSAGPRPLHTALRYGLSQALLHATALARRRAVAEIVAEEYGVSLRPRLVPICAQSGDDRYLGADKMIMKQVPVIPHGNFTHVRALGPRGEALRTYVRWLRERVACFGPPGYRPVFHLDLYGTAGELFDHDPVAVADFLIELEAEARPHRLQIEAPLFGESQADVLRRMAALVAALEQRGSHIWVVADEFANTLADIQAFAEARAAHMIQVKMPDLGGVTQSIAAVLACHRHGVCAFLGGTCNETDHASRMTVHIAVALGADQIYNKPGLSVDEGYMIAYNELQRVLAVLAARGYPTGPGDHQPR